MSQLTSVTPRLGTPWRYQLEIVKLEPGELDAQVSLVGEAWVKITLAILIILSLIFAVIAGLLYTNNSGAVLLVSPFSLFPFVLAIYFVGCLSYTARLTISEDGVQFSRCFFWSWKTLDGSHDTLQYVECWAHMKGSGSQSDHSFNVCLHIEAPIPDVCLYSQVYRIAGQTQRPPREEALQDVLNVADEIAGNLGIEHRKNTIS